MTAAQTTVTVTGSGVHYGTPYVDIDPVDVNDGNRTWRIDCLLGDRPGSAAYVCGSGRIVKKDGTLGQQSTRSCPVGHLMTPAVIGIFQALR